jgi:arabinofuranan 3-O-arabinosyltransferase
VVLTGHSHLAKASAPKAATIVSWTSSVRKLRVTAPTRSYLVVNENFNPGWRAVVHGRRLQPVRLDGWKQAWVLPAGTNGVATLTYQPESLYRDAVVGGLAALAVILLVAVLRFRRRATVLEPAPWLPEEPVTRQARWRRWLGRAAAAVILAGAGLVLGGYPGALLVPAAAFAFGFLARTRHQEAGPWLLASLLLVASACGAVGEHLALSGDIGLEVSAPANAIPQVICLIVVGGMAAALGFRPPAATSHGTITTEE